MKISKVILPVFCLCIYLQSYGQKRDSYIQPTYTKELKKITNNKKVKHAFEIIDAIDDQTIKDMIELTEVIASPFKETERALLFKRMIEAAGADKVWIDEIGNVLALRKGKTSEKLIGLDAHLDVVFPEGTDVTVKKVGDTLKAPGIGDNSRGLSMIIATLKAFNKAKIVTNNDILFVGSVGEEGLGDYASKKVNKYDSKLGLNNTPVIRLSEVILNRAEANAHIPGEEAAAQKDLNKIRQRAWPTAPDVTATGAQLIEEILTERRIELAYEGHRLWI